MKQFTIGPFLYVVLLALLGALLGVVGKLAVAIFPRFDVFVRRVIFTLFLAALIRWNHFKKDHLIKGSFRLIGILAAANTIFYTYGIQYTTASVGQLIYLTVPLWTLCISPFVLGKSTLSKIQYLGIVLSIAGAILFFNEKVLQFADTSLYGNSMVIFACICYAAYGIASKYYQHEYSSQARVLSYALVSVAMGGVGVGYIGLENIFTSSYFIIGIVLLLGVCSLISNLITQKAIEQYGAFIASAVFYIQPFVSLLLAYIILGEHIGLVQMIGGIMALGGAYLITKNKHR